MNPNDKELATFANRAHDLYRRFKEGGVPTKPTLERLQWLSEGRNLVETPYHVIDMSLPAPVVPGIEVLYHCDRGKFVWQPDKVRLHLSQQQRVGSVILGRMLQNELDHELTPNVVMRDYLLEHPNLIPEEWKGGHTHFWGTMYNAHGTGHGSGPFIPSMFWNPQTRAWEGYGNVVDNDDVGWNRQMKAVVFSY